MLSSRNVAFLLFLCVTASIRASAQTPTQIVEAEPARRAPAYCGIYSVYGALKTVGIDCEFRDLLRSEYITSSFGSSLDALKRGAEEHGAFTVAWTNMTSANLEAAPCPVVLHFSDERRIGIYNHWVLYLGTQDGMARIVDAPHKLELLPYSELLARWDSIGLLVSDKPINATPVRIRQWLTASLIMSVAAALSAIALYRRPARRRPVFASQMIVILVVSVLLSVGFHLLARDGMLRNARAVEMVQQSHVPISLPQLSAAELADLSTKEGAILVDARFEDAFARGHISGAINIPMTASRDERRALLKGVPRNKEIIMYCESARCAYAEHVGRSLVIDDYKDVSVLTEGWREWSSKNNPK